jgi:hypothetical protein
MFNLTLIYLRIDRKKNQGANIDHSVLKYQAIFTKMAFLFIIKI